MNGGLDSVVFLDKELFTDVTSGEQHEVDLVVRGRFKGQDSFFVIHLEQQAQHQTEFGWRMFRYFGRLHEKYGLPVYPVVVFSHDQRKSEANHYRVGFPGWQVLDFRYRVIHYCTKEGHISRSPNAGVTLIVLWTRPTLRDFLRHKKTPPNFFGGAGRLRVNYFVD